MSYITILDLADYMHTPWTSLNNLDLAQFACDTASDLIDDFLEHNVLATAVVEKYNGNNNDRFLLTGHPVINVNSIKTYDSSLNPASEADLVEDVDYTVDKNAGIVYCISTWLPLGVNNVVVDYVYGSSIIPNKVKVVAMQLAYRIYDVGMVESESTGSWSAAYVKGGANLTEDETAILADMRR